MSIGPMPASSNLLVDINDTPQTIDTKSANRWYKNVLLLLVLIVDVFICYSSISHCKSSANRAEIQKIKQFFDVSKFCVNFGIWN